MMQARIVISTKRSGLSQPAKVNSRKNISSGDPTLGLSANEARTLHIAGWDKGLSSYGLMRHVPWLRARSVQVQELGAVGSSLADQSVQSTA